jgi:hypothetical protein
VAHAAYSLLLILALAYDPALDPRDITQALAIGQSRSDADRARFHQPYRLPVNRAPVDYIDVVTPFRRVVLEAEARGRAGNRILAQRDAMDLVAGSGGRVQLLVEMTFHPLNTFVGVPLYVVTLVPVASPDRPVAAADTERNPRFGPRLEGPTPGTPAPIVPTLPQRQEPVLGGTVIASFDGGALNPAGAYNVVVSEAGKEVVRARLDLGALR